MNSCRHGEAPVKKRCPKEEKLSRQGITLTISFLVHQSPGYFDHVLELIVIIFKNYFENNQNILTSSSSMGFLPIKLMIIIISSFSFFSFIYFSTFV
jgi:hypothetical protein